MKKKYVHKIEHEGCVIGFLPAGKFEVIDEDGESKEYETVALAKDAIVAKSKRVAAMTKKKLNLRCTGKDGTEYYLKGVHAGHGHLIVTPTPEKYHDPTLYPYTESVRFMLAAIEQLKKRAGDMEIAMEQFIVKQSEKYHRRDELATDELHTEKVDEIASIYAANLKKAEEMSETILGWANGEPIQEKLQKKKIRF